MTCIPHPTLSVFRSHCLPALLALVFTGCASQRVVYHPSRQQPAKTSQAQPAAPESPGSGRPAAPPSAVAPAPMAPPVAVSRPVESVNNLTELRRNISNTKIAEDLIENKLSIEELEIAAATPSFAPVKPQILLKLGKTYQKNRDTVKAAEYYRAVMSLYPKTPYAVQASGLLSTIQLAYAVDARVVGAVLPLTGRMASIGQHALNAIRMGLELNRPDNRLKLALFDSQSNPDLAAQGVNKLVRDDKAIVILGGFTSLEATAIAHQAELLNVPFIGFSQKTGLTNIGDYVFRNALTPEMQVDTLVQFAFDQLGARKFAIVFPNDSYGVEFSNIFWDHVLARGGQITAAQTYDPEETDFSEITQKLLGTFYVEARAEEYRQRLAQLKAAGKYKKQTKKTRDHWAEENILPPIVDFDVVFVPDSSRALGQILAFMKYNEVRDMNYIGTNLWNSPDLPKRVAGENAGLYFVDAIDISQGTPQDNEFFKNYLAQYNESPTLPEVQAYEAAKIVRIQLGAGAVNRDDLASRLRYMGRTQGVTGELRMSDQRELERPIHILTLDEGLVKKIQ